MHRSQHAHVCISLCRGAQQRRLEASQHHLPVPVAHVCQSARQHRAVQGKGLAIAGTHRKVRKEAFLQGREEGE